MISDDYVAAHNKCWLEGYNAGYSEGSLNPYDWDATHYEYQAWEAGYWWYLSMVY